VTSFLRISRLPFFSGHTSQAHHHTWRTAVQMFWDWLPRGGTLSDEGWRQRHRVILVLLWLHVIGLMIYGVVAGHDIPHIVLDAGLVALAASGAGTTVFNRRVRSVVATIGLLTASAVLVHLTDGLTEAHFHFFIMIAVIALYEEWVPFLVGVSFVVLEHGTVGVLLPQLMYDHPDAWREPWKWAIIHGAFVLGLCAAMVAHWRLAELSQAARRHAALTQAQLAAIVTSSSDAILGTDTSGLVTSWNSGAEDVFGYSSAEILGLSLGAMVVVAEWRDPSRGEALLRGERIPYLEVPCRRKDGSLLQIGASISPILDENSIITGYSYIARDISERLQAEAALQHQALHDALTDLPNRILLRGWVERATELALRDGQSAALLVLDLDRFKEVNDTLGHDHGDLLLREVAVRLHQAVTSTGSVARLGGDEFAVLLPGTDLAQAQHHAEGLSAALQAPFELGGYSVETGVSIGIALAPEHGSDFETLLRRADIAMYVAKRSGSGSAVYTAEQDVHSPERLALIGELRQAIENDALVLHYQPKLDCQSGQLAGVEALVRWSHPERGLIPPDRFISLAEQTGLIRPLTQWVIRSALEQCRVWRDNGLTIPVAVNLSMRNLHEPDLVETIDRMLTAAGLPTSALELEITESSLMEYPDLALAVLTQLSEMGVRIAVDDFGTGYSSLAYLKDLPVHELKIDRSFVGDMRQHTRNHAIVRSTIDLAHHLGLRVVAEGVEDRETWELLGLVGCDVAQGYHLSRPLPASRVLAWSRAPRSIATPFDKAA
jgi:diguanylate cyclase (GGDEF)-like protein/PAS domain S-box-containing protein